MPGLSEDLVPMDFLFPIAGQRSSTFKNAIEKAPIVRL